MGMLSYIDLALRHTAPVNGTRECLRSCSRMVAGRRDGWQILSLHGAYPQPPSFSLESDLHQHCTEKRWLSWACCRSHVVRLRSSSRAKCLYTVSNRWAFIGLQGHATDSSHPRRLRKAALEANLMLPSHYAPSNAAPIQDADTICGATLRSCHPDNLGVCLSASSQVRVHMSVAVNAHPDGWHTAFEQTRRDTSKMAILDRTASPPPPNAHFVQIGPS
ncbi:hypothetical protein PYCCODRAFT_1105084 [Trametes coccinea BRFM310]|uniref:Uncharacterized protein n=1 Tax=Trametes coccinea (strain BRFM310) TaxID=1353009 RepID=A0A1Y2IAS9_TRAC3|nr:hypothetical protein PYCCODRAFT_1105084 [Trametes coccinea BRFM310]